MANLFKKIIVFNYQQVRFLPRWNHRRPIGVILPEEYDPKIDSIIPTRELKHDKSASDNSEVKNYSKIKWKQPSNKKFLKELDSSVQIFKNDPKNSKPLSIIQKVKPKPKKTTVDMLQATIDSEGNFIYTKMQNNDIRVSQIMAELTSKQVRSTDDLMLLEGKMLIKEALEAGCKLKYLLFSRMKEVEYLKPYLPKVGANLYKMPYKEIQNWSELVTTPGIMGIFNIPDTESFTTSQALPLTIICDNVREPNNLGAILRVSSGVGCEKIIVTKGCVNVWETKVLRSACGAHFKLHISKKPSWDEIRSIVPENCHVFVADNNIVTSQSNENGSLRNLLSDIPVVPYFSVNFKQSNHIVLIIGGETEGISEESYSFAKEFKGVRLNVPLSNGLDSLNTGTALGIIAFEVKRQLTALKAENLENYKVRNMSLNT